MKPKKLFLSLDEEESEDFTIGLVRFVKKTPDFEIFFKINQINHFNFSRKEDLQIEGHYYNYKFAQYETYHQETKTFFRFMSNLSTESIQKKQSQELFSEEANIKYLLNDYQDVDYIITKSDLIADFSLILLPEKLVFPIQDFSLSSNEELYQIIRYYE